MTWIKRLCNDSDHPWKIIPTKFLKLPNHNLIFHRNFSFDQTSLSKLQGIPVFYVDLLRYWSEFSKFESDCYQILLSESLWFNHVIKIGERSIFLKNFSEIGINTVGDVFNMDGSIRDFEELVQKGIQSSKYFTWIQLVNSIPKDWRLVIKKALPRESGKSQLDVTKYRCSVNKKMIPIKLLTCQIIYFRFFQNLKSQPTSAKYFEKKLQPQDNINWNHVFFLPRKVTVESKMRIFQFKILSNILFLNAKLFKMKIINSPLCSLCREENETTWHLFSQYKVTIQYWRSLQTWLKPSINLPDLAPESALLGLITALDSNKYVNT